MMLTEEQQRNLEQGAPKARNGLINTEKRWPGNVVVYRISDDFDTAHKKAIQTGIDTLELHTCLRFRKPPMRMRPI